MPCRPLRGQQPVDLIVRQSVAARADPLQLVRAVPRPRGPVELALDGAARNSLRAPDHVCAVAPIAVRVGGSGHLRREALQIRQQAGAVPDLVGHRIDQRWPVRHHRLKGGAALFQEIGHEDPADIVLVLEPEQVAGEGFEYINPFPDFRHAGAGEKRERLTEQESVCHVVVNGESRPRAGNMPRVRWVTTP
ncbi:hypothetical protein D3C72_1205670 [compost metagenome]